MGKGSFGSEFGGPIVANGDLLHSCVEVHEPIELSFGVVSVVSPGIGVFDEGRRVARGRRGSGGFAEFLPPFVSVAHC